MKRQEEVRKKEINRLEKLFKARLGVTFPQSYRQFLLEQGSAVVDGYQIFGLVEEEEEKGVLLSFRPGDPKRGSFVWIADYQEKIVGLCNRPDCWFCNLEERKKLEGFQGGELRVKLNFHQGTVREFYIAHLISVPERRKEKPKISVLEATKFLQKNRSDLPKTFIAISIIKDRRFNEERMMCLDTVADLLYDIALNQETKKPDLPMNQSFDQWMEKHQGYERRFKEAYQRVVDRRKETEKWERREFSHRKGGFLPKPYNWKPIISRAQDYVVGLTALRYNPRYNCLEVDEFYALDHPYYKSGEAIRNLTKIMFVMARDFSGSLNIIFTQEREDKKPTFFRPCRPVSQELVDLAKEYGITFEKAKEGKISHQEGVRLFFDLLEFPQEVREIIEKLEKAGYLSKEMVAEVIATGIWNREEAIWLFLNIPRPEAVLLGTVPAENRIYHSEAVNYARSVLLATRLKQVIMLQMRGGFSPEEKPGIQITFEPKEKFWILKGSERYYLPPSWLIGKSEVWIEVGESILLLSRPRIIANSEQNVAWLKEDIELLLQSETEAKVRCLVTNYEFISQDYNSDIEGIKKLVREAVQKGVYILFPPARTSILLDEEIEKRMRRSRAMKEFPLREGPLKLWVFEIPAYDWDVPSGAPDITRDAVALRNASRDAIAFGGYIFNKIDIHRCRRQFAFNCEVVERLALCYPKSKKIAEFDGQESQEVLTALKGINSLKGIRYDNITFSYVRPNEMTEFLSRIRGKVRRSLERVQGGIVVVVVPYKKTEISEVPMVKAEAFGVPFEIPEIILAQIDAKIEEKLTKKEYVSHETQVRSAHQQIREALKAGLPLAASWIDSRTFVEIIPDYLKHRERWNLFFWRKRIPQELATLRLVYNDGSEGKPFPLFCLKKGFSRNKNLFEHHSALVSLRHMEVDYFVENSIIRNREIQRRENAAEQEDIAFRKTHRFLEVLIQLIRREIDIKDIEKTELIFHYLFKRLSLGEKRAEGLELHLYLSTGLEPATIGAFRAVVEILKQRRGQLVVVPRLFTGKIKEKITPFTSKERILEIRDTNYAKGEEWF